MRGYRFSAVAFAAAMLVAGGAHAQATDGRGDVATGRAFALQVCTPCHVVSPRQLAPRRLAVGPSFAAIADAPTTTPSGLRAFLSTPHPSMPNLILSRREQMDVIAYIMSLKR